MQYIPDGERPMTQAGLVHVQCNRGLEALGERLMGLQCRGWQNKEEVEIGDEMGDSCGQPEVENNQGVSPDVGENL